MVWGKAGSTTLTSAGDTITISSMTASKFNQFLEHEIATGNIDNPKWTFNNNTNSVYGFRINQNGGSDGTSVSQTGVVANLGNAQWDRFNVNYVCSISGEEKLLTLLEVASNSAGAGNAPARMELVGKFVPSPDADITRVDVTNGGVGDFDTSSNISALGSEVTPAPAIPALTNVQDNSIFVEKSTAKRYWGSLASETTASDSVTDTSGGQALYSGSSIISAEKFTTGANIIGKVISKVEFPIYKQGTGGGGTATAGVFDSSGNTLFTFGTLLASTVADYATPFTWYSFENLTGYEIEAGHYIGLKYDAGDSSNRLIVRTDDVSPPYADGVQSHFTSSWADVTGVDQSFKAYSKTGYTWTRELPTLPTISDLVLHLDANASSTITKDSSNLVATWGDGSSASNDITASGSARPTWVDDTQTGLPVIRFDGSNNVMTGTTPSYSLPNTLFMVCTTPNADSEAMFDGDTSRNLFNRQGTNTYRIYAGAGVTGGTANVAMQVFTVVFNNGSPALNINGSAQSLSGTNIGTSALDDIVLGAFDGGSGKADYDVCEVLFYNKTLSTSEISSVESYLNKKWGVY